MKILTSNRYRELLSYKNNHDNFLQSCATIIEKLESAHTFNINRMSFEFSIRRAIIGGRGTGKTELLKNKILPTLKNYFLIDMNNEYLKVSPLNKYVVDKSRYSRVGFTDLICDLLKENYNKIIIVEDCMLCNINKVIEKLIEFGCNFIIVAQNNQQLYGHINTFDMLYHTGREGSNYFVDIDITEANYFSKRILL